VTAVRPFELDATTWKELDRLLDAVLDVPAEGREAWLLALPAEAQPLVPHLRALLTASSGASALDALPAVSTSGAGPGEDAPLAPGALVGPYRLLRPIGRGGMGEVWLARRDDGMVQREVALKLPHGAGWDRGLRGRMAREREILAALAHPNIARLYDAGVDPAGRPWLALEYVEGEPLDAYARARGLGVRARLELFLQVARAVAHAHAKLVVHRDLKPSNVLVTPAGEVRLLDFGIAKLVEPGDGGPRSELTRAGLRVATPAYASPEQLRGEPIGVGSDVYSLGVVLYELLSGKPPYAVPRTSAAALEQAVLETDPQRPSAAAEDRVVRRELRGDLDAVVLKALRKAPAERYPTVEAFAEDVERWRSGHPVRAQPDRLGYRVGKLVRRHRLAVGAAAAVLVAILAGAGAALWQARAAREEARRAEEVKQLVTTLLRDANLEEGETQGLSARDLLLRAARRVDDLPAATAPEVRLELLVLAGGTLASLAEWKTAGEVLDRAGALRDRLPAGHPLALRADLLRAWTLVQTGKTKAAQALLEAAGPALEAAGGALPAEDRARAARIRCAIRIDEGRPAEGIPSCEEAARIAEAGLGPGHPETLTALDELSYAQQQARRGPEALATATRARDLALTSHAANPGHPSVMRARKALGNALAQAGKQAEAVAELEEARRAAVALYGPEGGPVGVLTQNLVNPLLVLGRVKEALAASELALRLCRETCQADSYTGYSILKVRGLALSAAWRFREAVELYDRADAVGSKVMGAEHRLLLQQRALRARALAYAGEPGRALQDLEALVEVMERVEPREVSLARRMEITVRRLGGDPHGALSIAEAQLAPVAADPTKRLRAAQLLTEVALCRLDLGHALEAEVAAARALRLYAEEGGEPDPTEMSLRLAHGRALLALGRPREALRPLEEVEAYWRDLDPGSRWAAEAAAWAGRARRAR